VTNPLPPAVVEAPEAAFQSLPEAENQLAEARDALQRQALEIETKTALMEKQLAEMEQALKDRENAELRASLDALKQQNDDLRVQADSARRQSNVITQRIATTPRESVTPQVSAPRDYSMFYDRLAPYGRWMDVNGYGYCWRPTLTESQGWRPYVDGCWVWSTLGWTWQSNEPFGWATYHYGRWVNLSRHGWVWVPGSDWAPAWVAGVRAAITSAGHHCRRNAGATAACIAIAIRSTISDRAATPSSPRIISCVRATRRFALP
jgi:hypothetical protein